jgi:uncharacterized protein (DUF433 family)
MDDPNAPACTSTNPTRPSAARLARTSEANRRFSAECYTRDVRTTKSIYGSSDPRVLPAYGIGDAAHYLLVPIATLRSWVVGRPYPTKRGAKYFEPVVIAPKSHPVFLSFVNLVEVHVLDAIRRKHRIPLDKVRLAMDYLRREFHSKHPLADHRFETDGMDLFIQRYGSLINITRSGQLAMRQVLQAHLRRIERDPAGRAVRLYPFTRKRSDDEPKVIVIDPAISFGKPVMAGSGIPTAIVAERYKAGETIEELAKDYEQSRLNIEEAIRCELQLEAA